MSIGELGSIGEFISSIAVVVSVLYLAIQIRGQRKEQKQQSLQLMWNAWNESGRSVVEHSHVPELIVQGSNNFNDLDPAMKMQFQSFMTRWLKAIEPLYYLYLEGTLDAEAWQTTETNMKMLIRSKGFAQYWVDSSKLYRPEFRATVEKLST